MKIGSANPQLLADGRLGHLLSIEHLSERLLRELLNTAESFVQIGQRAVKKTPVLRGKTVVNLFFENSTRTRTTFELAAKRLSADVLNISVATSSQSKGESLIDTIDNLMAMHVDGFVIRHADAGAPYLVASHVGEAAWVINAGDGCHAHPTQGLLDVFTIIQNKGPIDQLSIAIVGDILHSRVARSQIHALSILGCQDLRVIAPKTLLPEAVAQLGVQVFHDLDSGLDGVDVVATLRLQRERMTASLLPSADEYFRCYGLTQARLRRAKADAIVLHPGPMNRGVEIDSAVADGLQSVILPQVTYGLAIRMAVLSTLAGAREHHET